MKQMLNAAIVFAATKHDGQYDQGGHPYITHVLKVMYLLKTDDEELQCIAVLHDVVEDCYEDHEHEQAYQDLRDIGQSERVIRGVRILTKFKGQEYEDYVKGVISSYDTIRAKKADLRHNMDLRRMKGVTAKDLRRIEKYVKFYALLDEEEKKYKNVN